MGMMKPIRLTCGQRRYFLNRMIDMITKRSKKECLLEKKIRLQISKMKRINLNTKVLKLKNQQLRKERTRKSNFFIMTEYNP